MATLTKQFNEPLPNWTAAIRNEARGKIIASRATAACFDGDVLAIREILIRFWPFVNAFPQILRRGCARVIQQEVLAMRLPQIHRIPDLISLLLLTKTRLEAIRRDEMAHRKLWLKTTEALGLDYKELDQPALPAIITLQETVGEPCAPATMFLKFVAVEILAEGFSETLLQSDRFRSAVGEKGLGWFLVHTDHREESHESLAYRLAFCFHEGLLEKDRVNATIQQIIDLFVEAGKATMTLSG